MHLQSPHGFAGYRHIGIYHFHMGTRCPANQRRQKRIVGAAQDDMIRPLLDQWLHIAGDQGLGRFAVQLQRFDLFNQPGAGLDFHAHVF